MVSCSTKIVLWIWNFKFFKDITRLSYLWFPTATQVNPWHRHTQSSSSPASPSSVHVTRGKNRTLIQNKVFGCVSTLATFSAGFPMKFAPLLGQPDPPMDGERAGGWAGWEMLGGENNAEWIEAQMSASDRGALWENLSEWAFWCKGKKKKFLHIHGVLVIYWCNCICNIE